MNNQQIKHAILDEALKNVPFDGWTKQTFQNAAHALGYDAMMFDALFPNDLNDTFETFASWANGQMLENLRNENHEDLRTHEKIELALQTRITILQPHKDSVRESAKQLATPQFMRTGTQITWDCADVIWNWVGDTSTDYNHYTKRGLLSAVIGSTMLFWLQDDSKDSEKTFAFLNRRLKNALSIGKNAAPVIKPVASLIERFIVRTPS